MAELKTRIILRNDITANWEKVKDTLVLLKGEVAVEFDPSATGSARRRVKIGDGVSVWSALPYFGESEQETYQAEVDQGADHAAKIAEITAGATLHNGDTCIIKEAIDAAATARQYTAYVYDDGNWVAMDGNYSAENVYFREDLTYTKAIGELPEVPSSGAATLAAAGKNVKTVLSTILAQRKQPTITQPTASLTWSGVTSATVEPVEPGYVASGTVSYGLQLNYAGNYTYGPETGVTESGTYSITYDDGTTSGQTASTKTGTFAYDFIVGNSNKSVKITASSVGHTDGVTPKDNLGDDATVAGIAAGTVSAGTKTATFTSSRKSFWSVDKVLGTTLHPATTVDSEKIADSTLVRALENTAWGAKTSYSLSIAEGINRVIIAVPGSHSMTSCIDVDGMGLDVKDNFTVYTNNIYVGGCDATDASIGSYPTTYTVFVVENAAGLAKTTYNITLA